jgi:hypothetical protein
MNINKEKQQKVSIIISFLVFFSFVVIGISNISRLVDTNLFYVNIAGIALSSFMLLLATTVIFKKIILKNN